MLARRREEETPEISMSPMIDMVFLLLVFFLVATKPIKEEGDLSLELPGEVAQDAPLDLPDEQRIEIHAGGQVALNEELLDDPSSRQLPTLRARLREFKRSADASKSEALVTLDADDASHHQRIAEVMDACASVGITGVTFAGVSEDDEL